MADVQKKLQADLEKYQQIQKDYQKSVNTRQQLDAQLSENNLVKEEVSKLEPGANIYKMIGPVLVKQNVDDAKQNVQKRIDYISGVLKRQEENIKDLESQQESYRENLAKLQQQFQQQQQKVAAKS